MSTDPEQLQASCAGIHQGCAEAIDWVNEVRNNSVRVDRESENLVMKIRRMRNLAVRLGSAAGRPMSVGFFGLSQAGKSYLISTLAAGRNGELETQLDDERLNFISHVNPPGGGKEATGLVTRFTYHKRETPAGFPLQLALFSEADLVKILGNAFFNDFDLQKVECNTEPEHIRSLLAGLEKKRRPQATGGVSEDDVVDLYDYFDKRFTNAMKPLAGVYWPTAIELAPYLQPEDRATLFSVLWGEVGELSQTYLMLRKSLQDVQFADTLFCPISALVVRGDSGEWSQADSIMNVDILERLGRDNDDLIEVQPVRGEDMLPVVGLPRSVIAALTAEMRFELAEKPVADMLESVDLLDFPGYRGRLSVCDLEDVRKQLKDDQVDPVAQLVLRGKVAYLFERYTDDQEMNVLVLCTPSHKQMDVNSLGPVLETWIHSTQGETPEVRAGKVPGLVWAVTMFDFRLAPVPNQTADMMKIGWEGMMKMALLERFGQYDWVQDWARGTAFNNLFLVRKPCMAAGVISTSGDNETGVVPEQQERLAQLRSTFLADPTVQAHVRDPEQTWDAMLAFNDGGISRLAAYLDQAARLEHKLARIGEQVEHMIDDLVNHRLGAYYQKEGDEAVGGKERMAAEVVKVLGGRGSRFGELLHAMQLSADRLRPIYLRAEEADDEADQNSADDTADSGLNALDSLIDLNLGGDEEEEETPAAGAPAQGGAVRFAKDALRDWIGQVRDLPERDELIQFLGLPRNILEKVGDELITAADRLKLEEQLVTALHEAESRTSATRYNLVERQVLALRSLLNDFVDHLGNSGLPLDQRPDSAAVKGRKLFQPPQPIPSGQLPQLAARPVNYSALFILDWFEAFKRLAVDNAGYAAGRDITPQQNQQLGSILATISGRNAATATEV
ncbi:MAG TPA: hypothetical protein ENJ80_09790 [Gammaproteobacteria bacterium]|nr:hypothetical protein [Gammaproteobacteria bacterium]